MTDDSKPRLLGLAEAMHAGIVETTVREARSRVLAATKRSHGPVLALGLAVATACVVLAAKTGAPEAAISFRVGGRAGGVGDLVEAAASTTQTLSFSEGTSLELAGASRARVLSLDAGGGVIRLERGTLHASFQHRSPRTHWTIEAGEVSVSVTGTRFDVTFEPEAASFVLAMHEGSVGIHGCGLTRSASGSDVVTTDCKMHASSPRATGAVSSAPSSIPVLALPDSTSERGALSPPAPPASPAPKNISRAATSQEKAAPLESEASLVARANAARLAGDVLDARATLMEIRRRFQGRSAAAQAAFDLGTIAFDLERRHAEAAHWFRTYRSESPSGPLAREALGRMMESLAASGDDQGAAAAARNYLRDYSGGSHARLARRLSPAAPDR